jgi:hypothetical protein
LSGHRPTGASPVVLARVLDSGRPIGS